jgi:hypothetical protein
MNSITRRNNVATTVATPEETAKIAYDAFKNSLKEALLEKEPLVRNQNETIHREQRNLVIASGTQNGKTREIIDIIKNSGKKSLCLLSCDNRKDQLIQLTQRLTESKVFALTCEDIKISKSGGLTAPSLKKFKKYFKDHKRLVVVLLNNNSQCSKAKILTESVLNDNYFGIERFHMIHDEADLVNKSDNDKTITQAEETAKVQKEWIAFFTMLRPYTDLKYFKRIWVSATPENCSLIKDVKAKDVFVLPKNINYRDDITHVEWCGDSAVISPEVARIRKEQSREVILFCAEHTNVKQREVSLLLFGMYDCPVITYNCDGIFGYSPGREDCLRFEWSSIDQVLGSIEENYNGPIIIVGGGLLSRGISFVGFDKKKPRTATVMFYLGSDSTNAVAIAQRIGRITGTSRPDINKRVLYTRDKIFECYTSYLKNQETIYNILKNPENAELLVAEILETEQSSMIKLGRNMDRLNLKKTNATYDDACGLEARKIPTVVIPRETGSIMQKHVKRWLNASVETDISKVFREAYANPGHRILTSEISKYIKESNVIHVMSVPHTSNWNTVFSKDSQFHYIKPEAVAFANSLTKN